MRLSDFPNLGLGVGLRRPHFQNFLEKKYGEVRWVEVISENYMPWRDGEFRRPLKNLLKIREELPVAMHGVSMSLGSAEPLDLNYLKRLKTLMNKLKPAWISDHLCWTAIEGQNLHDLLPLPYTQEALKWVTEKIKRVQDFLGRRLMLENVSSYAEFKQSEMSEWEFLSEVADSADCGILLDINNVYVSSVNHEFDPNRYLQNIPWGRVGQIHLAGHTDMGDYLIDTHDEPVCDPVWELYRNYAPVCKDISVMIERDDNIPSWETLYQELLKAKSIISKGENVKFRKLPKNTLGASTTV